MCFFLAVCSVAVVYISVWCQCFAHCAFVVYSEVLESYTSSFVLENSFSRHLRWDIQKRDSYPFPFHQTVQAESWEKVRKVCLCWPWSGPRCLLAASSWRRYNGRSPCWLPACWGGGDFPVYLCWVLVAGLVLQLSEDKFTGESVLNLCPERSLRGRTYGGARARPPLTVFNKERSFEKWWQDREKGVSAPLVKRSKKCWLGNHLNRSNQICLYRLLGPAFPFSSVSCKTKEAGPRSGEFHCLVWWACLRISSQGGW